MRAQLLCTLNLWPATPTRRVKTECVKTDRVKTELCETVLLVHEHSDEMDYIAVMEEGKEPVEVELEEDLTIALSTLSNEFGTGISGLSYRNPKTGLRRVLRVSGDGTRVNPPREGWSSELTYVVSRVKSEEIGVPVEKVTPGENQLSVKKEVKDAETKATAGFSGLLQPVLFLFFVCVLFLWHANFSTQCGGLVYIQYSIRMLTYCVNSFSLI